ncbi:MAG: UDP-N-acetylmuramoyl-L-alanine--D-glutamate ligase [Anaerolineales bacterium]|jgi:UDP-N-acetylmuramoylalanine--D-glutamate ligase
MNWKDKRVVVIGAARQGIALTRYLAEKGAQVVLNDRSPAEELNEAQDALAGLPVEWVLGDHPLSLLDGADLVCPSGGVPLTIPLVVEAQSRGIPLSNDSQIFLEAAPCKVIGITGSSGKTTTTTLTGLIGQAADGRGPYRKTFVGGNIGSPLIAEVDEMKVDDLAVVEFSSFQLEIMTRSPHVAVILNVAPNHLDRHGTMEAYIAAKLKIFKHQKPEDAAVLWRDDEATWDLKTQVKGKLYSFGLNPLLDDEIGAMVRADSIWLRTEQGESEVMPVSEIQLRGEHNMLNVLAACSAAAAAGLPVDAMRAATKGFTGVPHRLEFVRTLGGADWYNDSKATSPQASITAIRAFDEPLIVLSGGRDKDLPWDEFIQVANERVDHLILFGEAADVIRSAMGEKGYDFTLEVYTGLEEAVDAAAEKVSPGDVVLLAPGGTSFDEFQDFEERGQRFKEWVCALRGEKDKVNS